ncbi:hypothetical protein [Lentibacillus sp. CBA3610]|nr:hypothetical protein [Lentibacillus sp. CBA3610]
MLIWTNLESMDGYIKPNAEMTMNTGQEDQTYNIEHLAQERGFTRVETE